MSRRVLIPLVLLLLLPLCTICAFTFDFDNRILLGSGNDRLSMGLSKDNDDFVAFNSFLTVINGPARFHLYLDAYTDPQADVRHDELIFTASWSFYPYQGDRFRFEIRSSAGVDADGNLGLAKIEKLMDKVISRAFLEIPYVGKTSVLPYADLMLVGSYRITDLIRVGMYVLPQYWEKFRINFGAFMDYKRSGYSLTYDGSWTFTTRLDFGILVFEHRRNLTQSLSFGSFILDAGGFFREKTWVASDTYAGVGGQSINGIDFITQQARLMLAKWASITLLSRYTSGFPVLQEDNPHERIRRSYKMTALGFLWEPPELAFWIFEPFVEISGGYTTWQLDFIYNDKTPRTSLEALHTAFAHLRTGVYVIPEGTVVFDGSTLQLTVAFDLDYFFNADKITDYVMQDRMHKPGYTFNALVPSLYIGLLVGMDLF